MHQVAEHVHAQWFAERQGVDDPCHPGRHPTQLPTQHVAEARRHRDVVVPHPHPGDLPHSAGRDLVGDQLPQKQCVAARQLPKPPGAEGVHRSTDAGFDHAAGGCGGQRFQVQPRQQLILPQRRYGIGLVCAGSHGHHQPRATGRRQLVHDMRRQPVEKMRVVDTDQHLASMLLRDKGIDQPPHVGQRLGHRVGKQSGECAQRQRSRGLGAYDPVGAVACRGRASQYLSSEPRFAHTRSTGDDHAGVLAKPAQCTANKFEFTLTPSQRIAADHARTISAHPPLTR